MSSSIFTWSEKTVELNKAKEAFKAQLRQIMFDSLLLAAQDFKNEVASFKILVFNSDESTPVSFSFDVQMQPEVNEISSEFNCFLKYVNDWCFLMLELGELSHEDEISFENGTVSFTFKNEPVAMAILSFKE